MRPFATAVALLAAPFVLAAHATLAPAAHAQHLLLDSLRPAAELAVTRADWGTVERAAERLRGAIASAPDDPWLHYDLAYLLHRRGSALIVADSVDRAEAPLTESERMAARAQELGAGASALALRGTVTGQLAGVRGALAAIRLGPRAFRQLDDAVAQAPADPRVALLNGITRLNAPRAFGGGPAKGEPELRRAIALFANDTARSPRPTWGAADAHIWLAIALHRQERVTEARAELERALALAPGHAWVTRDLLPALDRPAR